MKNASFILLTLSAMMLVSCQDFFFSKVDLDKLPKVKKEIVVHAFCGEDSTFFIAAAQSKPILGTYRNDSDDLLDNAEVTIRTGSETVTLLQTYDEDLIKSKGYVKTGYGSEVYAFSFYANNSYKFKAGETYTVTVKKDDRIAASTFSIPTSMQDFSVKIDSTFYDPQDKTDNEGTKRYRIQFDWDADADNASYYFVEIYQNVFYKYQSGWYYNPVTGTYEPVYTNIEDKIRYTVYVPEQGWYYSNPVATLIEPEQSKAGKFSATFLTGYGTSIWSNSEGTGEFEMVMYKVKKEFADFHKTLELNNYNAGDPFAEPVRVSTNIEGGVGIAAGFTSRLKKIIYK